MAAGFAIWLTGLPASGKSTIRAHLVAQLLARGFAPEVLESDALRAILGADYDEAGRARFYGALAWIGALLARRGIPVIFDATANRRAYRAAARAQIPRFLEVFVDTPLAVCQARDPKGIYQTAGADPEGAVPGVQAPYEPPLTPDLRVAGAETDAEAAAQAIVDALVARGWV